MDVQVRIVDGLIAEIARFQHGVVARQQLIGAGISREQIAGRMHSGALIRVYPGVYRVGHRAPSVRADFMAAVLACGEEAALAGVAAAHLYAIVRGAPPMPEVISPVEHRLAGVRTRRVRRPHPDDTTIFDAIPATTVPRTLVDLAGVLALSDLSRACHEAQVRYRTTPAQVEEVLARRPTAKGAANLRRVVAGEAPVTLSRLESRFLALLRRERLPLPETNRPAGGRYVDCRWPAYALTVELDSYRFHNTRHAWELDRRREREAYARGDQFRRYTYADVCESPSAMLRELRELLS